MSIELHSDEGAVRSLRALETVLRSEARDERRPHCSGDLPMLLAAGPMFRRAVAGYDRFQVDTYVQWAEDELAAADREREHLLASHLSTRAALDEARQLLSHSSGGAEFLKVSPRIARMLAAAADEAEFMRAEAENHRSVAWAQAEVIAADARRVLADAGAEAGRVLADAVAEAVAEAGEITAVAARVVEEAERTRREAGAEAAARLETVRVNEQRAAERAAQLRRQVAAEAAAARLHARDEVVRMLSTGRDQRQRADAVAASTRERLDRDAATRCALLRARVDGLLAQVDALEHQRSALRAEIERMTEPVVGATSRPLDLRLRSLLERLGRRSRSLRAP